VQSLLFLIGRIRTKEGTLLTKAAWQRLAETQDLGAWLQQLRETPYAEAAEHAHTFEEFESALNQHFQTLKADLFSTTRYAFGPLLFRKYDIHNIKLLLKMRYGHKDLHKYLLPCGELSLQLLESRIVRNESLPLPLHWLQVIHKAEQVYHDAGRSLAAMDRYLDDEFFREMLELAKPWGGSVQSFVQQQIDAANLKLFWFSRKRTGENAVFLPGGRIPAGTFQPGDGVAMEQVLRQVFPDIEPSAAKNEALLQREIDDLLSHNIYAKRYTSQGILPVLVYFRAKEVELKNLKTGYLQKARAFPELAEYLRETYA
jgi:vacuolar-type H+-ATPase subunit C/Vma6